MEIRHTIPIDFQPERRALLPSKSLLTNSVFVKEKHVKGTRLLRNELFSIITDSSNRNHSEGLSAEDRSSTKTADFIKVHTHPETF